jgi:hypothetical protein
MILAIRSNASYLNEENACSRAGGHHFLSKNVPYPANNRAIHNEASIIKAVMSSAAKAELGSLYMNTRKGLRSEIFWRRWTIRTHPHQCKQTTQPQMGSSTNV